MYLFIFTLLLVLFQFVNSKSIIEDYDKNLKKADARELVLKDSISLLEDQVGKLSHFNLNQNEDGITYWESRGVDAIKLIPVVKDALYSMNDYEGEEHPLIPLSSVNGRKLIINTVKILNHKWLICDFTDGTIWGESLIGYDVDENDNIKFEEIRSTLYPVETY